MAIDSNCNWQMNNCDYDNIFTGQFNKVDGKNWYTGRKTIAEKKVYISTSAQPEWWKKTPPKGTNGRPGPFLTFSLERAKAFNRVVLEYPIAWSDLDVLFTDKQGGFETQEEVFKAGYAAYYSCKECEMSIKNENVADYLDWEEVKVIWMPTNYSQLSY